MEIITGGVTAAKGFLAAGVEAGIKYQNRKDMAMVYSKTPCRAAGVFTTNVVKAAPVLWDKEVVESEWEAQAIVVNSGIANACTGKLGYEYCRETAGAAADALEISPQSVLICSTGVIGMQLPMEKMTEGVRMLAKAIKPGEEAGTDAAKAIMTTDTVKKEVAVSFEIQGKTCHLGGMAKGSGMIHPNMATTLNFVTTDVAISGALVQKALSEIVKVTYNCLSVDGDTSTNDMVSVMANGMAGNEMIETENAEYEIFKKALYIVMSNMTKMLAADGEGASKLLECTCSGAKDLQTAITVAKSVIGSSLLKCAMFGEDANWGRVLCAIGYADAEFDIMKVNVDLASSAGTIAVCRNGAGVEFSEEFASKVLAQDEIHIHVDLQDGQASAKAWGCDLTYDYVKINGDYRS